MDLSTFRMSIRSLKAFIGTHGRILERNINLSNALAEFS